MAGAEVTSYMPEAKVIIWPQHASVTSKLKDLVKEREEDPPITPQYYPRLDNSVLQKIIASSKFTPEEGDTNGGIASEDTVLVPPEDQNTNGAIGGRTNSAMSDDFPPHVPHRRKTLCPIQEDPPIAVVHEKWLLDTLQHFSVQPYSSYCLQGLTPHGCKKNSEPKTTLNNELSAPTSSKILPNSTVTEKECLSIARRKSKRLSVMKR